MKIDLDILCLDNAPDIVNLMKVSLEIEVHSVATAITVKDAYAMLNQKQYDLFIIDVNLPDGNGLEFCRTLHERNKRTPIIAYSGAASDEERLAGYDAGAMIYITKPDGLETIEQIANVIRNDCARQNASAWE